MDARYHYDHKPARHKRKYALIVASITLLILGAGGFAVWRDIRKNSDSQVTGKAQTVLQARDDPANRLTVDESLFSMELPGDWKVINRKNEPTENSITWQSVKSPGGGRSLKIYIDTIPATHSVNRLLPVTAQGGTIATGDISENCATFTQGGTLNAGLATQLKDTPAKWNKVDFICDLPRVVDNEVGTGSTEGINTVSLTGPAKGTHKYFFLYTEHNNQPDYEIFYNALRTFKAK